MTSFVPSVTLRNIGERICDEPVVDGSLGVIGFILLTAGIKSAWKQKSFLRKKQMKNLT
jgi:hypothetical protein